MGQTPTRIVMDRSLDSLSAVREVVRDPGPGLHITLSDRDNMTSPECADIIVIAGEADDEATLERVWSICHAKQYPKVVLIAPGSAGRLSEEAIVQGASGVIDHAASAVIILKALTCIARGELWLDRQRTGRVFDRLYRGMINKANCGDRIAGC